MADQHWFYRNDDEWIAIVERLKLTACPHCKAVGTLVRHGYLRGYDGEGDSPQRKSRPGPANLLLEPRLPSRLRTHDQRLARR
jgi:hypothetical protein